MKSSDEAGAQTSEAELNAAMARAVVRIRRRYVGRGPTKATAFFRRNLVAVVMEDAMTQEAHSLALDGNWETVRMMNLDLDRAMESDLRAAIEGLTGCRVMAFLGASSIDPDICCHLYSLDRALQVRADHACAQVAQISPERPSDPRSELGARKAR